MDDLNDRQSFRSLIRDLVMSGAKLPPVFAQVVQAQGQWIDSSRALGEGMLRLGGIFGRIAKVGLTLTAALAGSASAAEKVRKALNKIAEKNDSKIADRFVSSNKDADRTALIEARKAYREKQGTKAEKQEAARAAYRAAAPKGAREDLKKTLEDINAQSKEAAKKAADTAHDKAFRFWRSQGVGAQQAEQLASKTWAQTYDTTFRTTKHSAENLEKVRQARSAMTEARQTATIVSDSKGFAKAASTTGLASSVGIMGGATVLGLAAQVAYLFWEDYRRRANKHLDGIQNKALEATTRRHKLAIATLESESSVRRTMFKNEEEMHRKRIENARTLSEMRAKALDSEIAMQKRLMNIENQRTRAQRQTDVDKSKLEGTRKKIESERGILKEAGEKYDMMEVEHGPISWWNRARAKYRGALQDSYQALGLGEDASGKAASVMQWAHMVPVLGALTDLGVNAVGGVKYHLTDTNARSHHARDAAPLEIKDANDDLVDESVARAVMKGTELDGFFGLFSSLNPFSDVKAERQRRLKGIMNRAKKARERTSLTEATDLDEFLAKQEEFNTNFSTINVGLNSKKRQQELDDVNDRMRQYAEERARNQTAIAAGRTFQKSFDQAVKDGDLVFDSSAGNYVTTNAEGKAVVVESEQDFENLKKQGSSQLAVKAAQDAEATEEALLKEQHIIQKKIEYEQISVALAQEQVKKQEELLKNLRDAVAKNYESDITGLFGTGNRKSAEEANEIFGKRADEMRRDLTLASSKYASDAESAEEYKLNQDLEIAERDYQRKVGKVGDTQMGSAEAKEQAERKTKYDTELFELQKRNALEEHKQWLQNQTKLFQAGIDAIKQQQEAYYRMLNKQFDREVTNATAYGKTSTQVYQDLQMSRIEQAFDQRKTDFQSRVTVERADSENQLESLIREAKSKRLEEQKNQSNEIEEEIIKNKYELERKLAVEEHQLRVDLIKAEFEMKKQMDKAEKDREINSIASLNEMAKEDKAKEDLDKESEFLFNGQKFDELDRDQRSELFSSIATREWGKLHELLDLAGKNLEDYGDLTGDELVDAIKKDAQAAYDKKSDEEKSNARGAYEKELLEGLGEGTLSRKVLVEDIKNEGKSQEAYDKSIEKFEDSVEGFNTRIGDIQEQARQNDVEIKKKQTALTVAQEKENAEADAVDENRRKALAASWDTYRTAGEQDIDLQKRQEMEGYKIGMAQIARHETTMNTAFTEKLGATEGNGYTAAVLKEQNDQAFNNALDDLEDRQAAERQRLREEKPGDDRAMMQLEARQEMERKNLETDKKISDTMLQRRIGSETGSTTDAMSMWEQIQASAFGHIEDPTVAAIDSLREQQREQSELMLKASLDQMDRIAEGNDKAARGNEIAASINETVRSWYADNKKDKQGPPANLLKEHYLTLAPGNPKG